MTLSLVLLAVHSEADPLGAARLGLYGVLIGSAISLVGSVVVPWVRDVLDRRRRRREIEDAERREWLMNAITALLDYRQAKGLKSADGMAQARARFGTAVNQLRVRLRPEEEDACRVLLVMLEMVQRDRAGIADMVGETNNTLIDWVRGDVSIEQLVPEVERRAGVTFSADRSYATPNKRAG